AGDAAVRSGSDDRAGGLGAEGVRDEAGGDRGAGTAGRAAGPPLRVPGGLAGALERGAGVTVAATAGEFDHGQLGGKDGAGAAEFADDGGVVVEDRVAVGWRAPGGRGAASGGEILGAVGDAEEWAVCVVASAIAPASDRAVFARLLQDG